MPAASWYCPGFIAQQGTFSLDKDTQLCFAFNLSDWKSGPSGPWKSRCTVAAASPENIRKYGGGDLNCHIKLFGTRIRNFGSSSVSIRRWTYVPYCRSAIAQKLFSTGHILTEPISNRATGKTAIKWPLTSFWWKQFFLIVSLAPCTMWYDRKWSSVTVWLVCTCRHSFALHHDIAKLWCTVRKNPIKMCFGP